MPTSRARAAAGSPQSADDDHKNFTVPFLQSLKETRYVEARTWRSNIAGRREIMIGCQYSPPNWFVCLKRYHAPSTPYERALRHPKVPAAVKQRLRDQYRTLNPVALLADIRTAQEELGNRIDRRPGSARCQPRAGDGTARVRSSTPNTAAFAKTLGVIIETRDPRATHRLPKRPYKTRIRMPSKLDPHVATVEGWLAAEPQLTALAIVCRLSESYPEQFGTRQHSIVQRLLKSLRKKAAEKLIAQEPPCPAMTIAPLPEAVDGSGYAWPDPPTASPAEQVLEVDRLHRSVYVGSLAPTAPPG
jgi:hypothetical protein